MVFIGGYALVAGRSGQAPSLSPAEHAPLLPDFAAQANQIASITFRKGQSDLVLDKKGEGWVIPSKGGYAADNARVRDSLRTFANAKIIEEKTSKPELYSRLGVEDPDAEGSAATLVTFKDAAGKTLQGVIVGRQEFQGAQSSAFDETAGPRSFVRLAGQARSYLASGDFRVENDAREWMVRALEDLRPERVRRVQTLRQGEVEVDISRASKDQNKFTLDALPEGRKLKDDFILTRLANCFSGATFDDVAKADTIDANGPDSVTYRVACFDGLVIEAKGVKQGDNWWWGLHAGYEPPPVTPEATAKDETTTTDGSVPAASPEPDAAKPESSAAQPADGSKPAGPSEELAAEIEAMNAKWAGWVYQLPEYKSTLMSSTLESLLAPPPGPADSGAVPGAVPGVMPGLGSPPMPTPR